MLSVIFMVAVVQKNRFILDTTNYIENREYIIYNYNIADTMSDLDHDHPMNLE